jgi:hypothetical protein
MKKITPNDLKDKSLNEVINILKNEYSSEINKIDDDLAQFIVYKHNLSNVRQLKELLNFEGDFSKINTDVDGKQKRDIHKVISDYSIGFGIILFAVLGSLVVQFISFSSIKESSSNPTISTLESIQNTAEIGGFFTIGFSIMIIIGLIIVVSASRLDK